MKVNTMYRFNFLITTLLLLSIKTYSQHSEDFSFPLRSIGYNPFTKTIKIDNSEVECILTPFNSSYFAHQLRDTSTSFRKIAELFPKKYKLNIDKAKKVFLSANKNSSSIFWLEGDKIIRGISSHSDKKITLKSKIISDSLNSFSQEEIGAFYYLDDKGLLFSHNKNYYVLLDLSEDQRIFISESELIRELGKHGFGNTIESRESFLVNFLISIEKDIPPPKTGRSYHNIIMNASNEKKSTFFEIP